MCGHTHEPRHTKMANLNAKATPFVPPPLAPFIDEIIYLTVNWVGYDDRETELFQLHRSKTPSWIFDFLMTPNQIIVSPMLYNDNLIAEVVTKLYSYRYTDVCRSGGVGVMRHRKQYLPTRVSGLEYTYQNTITIHNPIQRLKPRAIPMAASYKQMLCKP